MIKTLAFILGFGLSFSLSAQSTEEKEVVVAVETLRKAMIDPTKTTLESFVADELSYGHSNGLVEDKATFVESLVSGKTDFVTIDLSEQTIRIVGSIAIVRNKFLGELNRSGAMASVNIMVLMIWNKQQGKWKLLARQGFKLPEKK